MDEIEFRRPVPRWAVPLERPTRYQGARGGRAGGKSHYFASKLVARMIADPGLRWVCVREIQKSLKYSAKSLIESKIREMGVGHAFEIVTTEIRRRGGSGICLFQGMQEHTADSVKSLEGFGGAWVEEAQNLSKYSLDLLLPTIRADGSEVWFSWNPRHPTDPVDELLVANRPDNAVVVTVNYWDNPWVTDVSLDEARRMRRVDPDGWSHIWAGKYTTRSDAQVLRGKWRVAEFEPGEDWDGPYFGSDYGDVNPTALTRSWVWDNRLFIDYEAWAVRCDYDRIGPLFARVPGAKTHTIRAEPARPGVTRHVRKAGFNIVSADKWPGSVDDGIMYLRGFDEIVIHPRCPHTIDEARLWRYKVDKRTGDILPDLVDADNHCWDATRYAHAPMVRSAAGSLLLIDM